MSASSSTSSTSISAPSAPSTSMTASTTHTRARSSISTRSMARTAARDSNPLTQTTLNVSSFCMGAGTVTEKSSRMLSGGKRKIVEREDEGRKRKAVRYSMEEANTKMEITTTTPPGSPHRPITPIRSVQPISIPTPARDILRAGYESEAKDEEPAGDFIVKPPTPPRMKPRPPIEPSSAGPVALKNAFIAPTTPGKRCLSPDQVEHRSAKRIDSLVANNPTTPVRATTREDIAMFSVSRQTSDPIRTTIASPHRALSSISRLNTPKRSVAELKSTTPGMARMTPTVPVPFSFTTPRSKPLVPIALAEANAVMDLPVASSSTLHEMTTQEPSKEVRPLPKRATMAPPSKIPVRAAKTSLPSLSTSTAGAGASKPKPALGVAGRRPSRNAGPGSSNKLAVFNENTDPAAETAPVRRKPSYPSSLGSGPLAQPRPRLISGPIQVPRSFTAPLNASTSDQMDVDERPGMRSVSDPVPRVGPRPSLSASTSRREGFSADTNRSLAGLSDALAKLKVRRDANTAANAKPGSSNFLKPKVPTILTEVPDHVNANNANTNPNISVSSSSRLSSVHRPRSSIAGADVSMMEDGDRSIAALISSSTGSKALKGVVAFVDVRTEDGACSGDLWSEMLRSLGAKVS